MVLWVGSPFQKSVRASTAFGGVVRFVGCVRQPVPLCPSRDSLRGALRFARRFLVSYMPLANGCRHTFSPRLFATQLQSPGRTDTAALYHSLNFQLPRWCSL